MRFDPIPQDVAAALEQASRALDAFGSVRYCAEVGSTNDAALALALAGAPEGTSVLAGQQVSGRGRRGQSWFSPPGAGLYLSVVVRPPDAARAMSLVTIGAGVAVARAVKAVTGLPAELKWPNDVVIGRPWRKLGGVLSEAASVGARVEAIVIGVGLNLQSQKYPPELADRATSLEVELGRLVDRPLLIVEVLGGLRDAMRQLHGGHGDAVCRAWRELGAVGLGGAAVRWRENGTPRRGRARDLDVDGALIVDVDGRPERLVAGEVLWESLSRE